MKPILILATNQDHYEGYDIPTGLWLGELTHFIHIMEEKGIPFKIASLKGGEIPLDPYSLSEQFMDEQTLPYYDDLRFMSELVNSQSLDKLNPEDYSAIYFAGGHGAMYDFVQDPRAAQWILAMTKMQKPVAAVCHGVAALTNQALEIDDQVFVEGKTVTGYTNAEELHVGHSDHVPFLLQDRLQRLGANFGEAGPFQSHVQLEGRLLTGQNPQSTKELAETLADMLLGEAE
ncbi:type 1 glutamine amidotransferase domain-containing protein [Streptococcus sobrinus]|uniref:type 1 glutamine amidotransferase domain-containing protein n=3 Tax=Streptococcus sobrinus TaxID=1310 RepID=UPI0002D522ED|nr:type 1 glutamine amidotransferase domain-containing protein [Streptococcus sobrinus]